MSPFQKNKILIFNDFLTLFFKEESLKIIHSLWSEQMSIFNNHFSERILILIFLLFCNPFKGNSQVVFTEDFEGGLLPVGWSYVFESGAINWTFATGGNTSHPATAHGGIKNALFFRGSYSGETTKLVSSSINLSAVNLPVMKFWHTQDAFGIDQDQLKVYYKTSAGGAWTLLATYTSEIINWTQESISLPNKSATYFIAFEARTGYGYGVCVDDVTIEQTPPVAKSLSSLIINQASTNFVLKSSSNNSILRFDLNVAGNSGTLFLNSLEVNALNTDNSFVTNNGVKLYATTSASFSTTTQIGASQSFSVGKAIFSALNYDLPPGISFLWVTYDIAPNALPDYTFDAFIDVNKINIAGTNYPTILQSPPGSRTLIETVFQDDFETDHGWILSGEFERNVPQALGGSYENPDPPNAYSGTKVLGTDLSGLGLHPGDYESMLANHAYLAYSPIINCKYYTNTRLRFYRWLNIENWDMASVDISNDSGATWQQIWINGSTIHETEWALQDIDISYYADKKQGVMIRFGLGSTDGTNNCSGWNIDDLVLTGDFINPELSISKIILPESGCNHTVSDSVRIIVKNLGGLPTNDSISVCFSPDGGLSTVYDTIFSSIACEDSLIFTFRQTVNLTSYSTFDFFAATLVPGDKHPSNDTLHKSVTVSPQFTIPYFENFENGQNGWFAGGINNSWQFGTPSSTTIQTAASGINAWKTNLTGNYNSNESSFIQSPCFNFSGITDPYISFNLWWKAEPVFDGASLLYSINDGLTWTNVGSNGDFLHWYNFDTITSLNNLFNCAPGWSYENAQWIKVQHQLPAIVANSPNVKFRLVFASNYLSTDEGFAFDDIAIYDNQPDIGVTAINAPVSACDLTNHENITVLIKNFGSVIYNTGDTIRAGIIINGVQTDVDTIILAAPVEPGFSLVHTFSYQADFHVPGNYSLNIYTLLSGDLTATNNSFSKTISNYGHPVVSITNLDTAYCNSTPDVTLLGSPFGGTFSGNGITGVIFAPSSLIPASYQIIYTYSDVHSCENSDTSSTIIFALPVVNFNGLATSYCANASNANLTGFPSGGTFSGQGIVGNLFSPSTAGIGNHIISYLYTDNNHCANSISKSVDVFSFPTVNITNLNTSYCENELLDTLLGLPTGGSFSGLGITGNLFNPSAAGIGNHAISYLYTDTNNCSNTISKNTNVLSLPIVNFFGLAAEYCHNAAEATLIGVPSGGSFSGSGIVGNIFNATIANVGIQNISYLFTDTNNCSNSMLKNVNILEIPAVDFSGLNSIYCSNASTDTLSGLPSGGTFSGSGISGNIFSPSLAGVGNNNIAYSFTDGNNCSNNIIKNTEILSLPVVDFIGLNTEYCLNATDVTLIGSPFGGTFSGLGVSGNTFSPSISGIGNHSVTYSYTDGNNCTNYITKNTDVLSLPIVNFSGLDSSYCLNSSNAILLGSPSGGSYSGPGISGNIFSSSNAGSGNHTISYQFTDTNNCTNSAIKSVEVFTLSTVNYTGLDTSYCINSDDINLIGTPIGGIFSGAGITGDIFSAAQAGSGNFTITYQFTDTNSCSNFISKSVEIFNLPTINFSGLDTLYCMTSSDVTLTGVPLGGTFSGSGISGNLFSPISAGLGSHVIIYQYTDTNSCSNFVSKPVRIVAASVVSFTGLDSVYCENSSSVLLTGSPTGGIFSGSGINGNIFSPTMSGSGFHTITYQWTNNNYCSNSVSEIVRVFALPAINLGGLDTAYCLNAIDVPLIGSPIGGIFSGSGVSENIFSPVNSGVGFHNISYQLTDTNLCSNTASQLVHVLSLPIVNFSGFDSAYCINSPIQTLIGTPPGGTFSGLGINGNDFNSAIAGVGMHTVSYIYTDTNNCSNTKNDSTIIYELPAVGFTGLDTAYCQNHNSATLLGTPTGGTFFGNGITGNVFDPLTAGVGVFPIIYFYTSQSGCTSSDTQFVYVRSVQNPTIFGLDTAYCKNASSVILTGYPSGGIFIGDGITENIFSPSQTSSQNINITYTYTNIYGCESHTVQHVEVFNLPFINFSGLNNSYCVSALPDSLYGNPSDGVFYGNAVTDNLFHPSLSEIGEDTVYFTFTDLHNCTSTSYQTTQVYALPMVSMSGIDSTYCINQSASVLHGIPTGGVFSGGSMSGNIFSPEIAGNGVHSIVYTYIDENGCQNADTASISVFNLPIIIFNLPDSVYCKGSLPVSLAATPVGGLFFGEGVSGNIFKPELADTGDFFITYEYTDINGCGSIDSSHIYLFNTPDFAFTSDTLKGTFPFTIAAPSGFETYLWDDGTTQQTLTVTNPGWYSVTVSSITGCSASDSVYVVKSIDIDELSGFSSIAVFPNPASSYLNVKIELFNAGSVRIELTNTLGEHIFMKTIQQALKFNETIDVSEFAIGMYYLNITSDKAQNTQKLMLK